MTTARFGEPLNRSDVRRETREADRHWLIPYVTFQQASDKRVVASLNSSLTDLEPILRAVEQKSGPGAVVRTSQLQASVIQIKKLLHALFLNVGGIVREDSGKAASLAEDLLIKDEEDVWKTIFPEAKDRESNRNALLATADRNIQAVITRILQTEQPLSKRVWKSESLARGQLDKVINRNIATGASAQDLAREIREFVDPNTPGGASYRAKTLARTEINNAFHAQSINDMQNRPWIEQCQWNLSKSHSEIGCLCDRYAQTKYFSVGNVPKKPHPGCLCTVTPKLPTLEKVLKDFQTGQYSPFLPDMVS